MNPFLHCNHKFICIVQFLCCSAAGWSFAMDLNERCKRESQLESKGKVLPFNCLSEALQQQASEVWFVLIMSGSNHFPSTRPRLIFHAKTISSTES